METFWTVVSFKGKVNMVEKKQIKMEIHQKTPMFSRTLKSTIKIFIIMITILCGSMLASENNENFNIPKSITLDQKPWKKKSIIYNLYRNKNDIALLAFYSISKHTNYKVLISMYTGVKLYENISLDTENNQRNFDDFLNKYSYKKVRRLNINYERWKGRYYNLFEKKLFYYYPGECGSPFEQRYKIVNKDGSTYKEKSILMKGSFIYRTTETCPIMKGKSIAELPITAMGIKDVYKINDELYAVTMSDYPAVFIMDKTFKLKNKYNNLEKFTLVDYAWLQKKIDEIQEDKNKEHNGVLGLELTADRILNIINKIKE